MLKVVAVAQRLEGQVAPVCSATGADLFPVLADLVHERESQPEAQYAG